MKILLSMSILIGMKAMASWGGFKVSDWNPKYAALPPKPACEVKVKKTITLEKNEVFDGKGCLYTWRGAGYPNKCHSSKEISEQEPRMFIMAPGSKIQNLQMECSLDGILMNDNTVIQNVVNRDCEEDCVTTKGNNNLIQNNQFFFCQDKCIQMNKATNVRILSNKFFEGARPMSGSGAKSGGATGIIATSNECTNCEIMIRGQAKHDITASKNYMKNGECMFETVDQSVIYDKGDNVATGGATLMCGDGSKNVKRVN